MSVGRVVAVSRSGKHTFSKPVQESILLITGLGVEGDAHMGVTVKHRSRVKANPNEPNLRQVHLMHAELFDELGSNGFVVHAGELGENITTCNVDLLSLPRGARLRLGETAVVEITGLRNPCKQLDKFQQGLMGALIVRDAEGGVIRKSGVMGVVLAGGHVRAGDAIEIELPTGARDPLACV